MLHHLLVPLDGTPFAKAALPYAEALARRTGATLHLLRASLVRQPPTGETYEAQIVAGERAGLAEIARGLGARQIAATATVEYADPAEAIIGQARDVAADLIVMTTHARGLLGRAAFGSVVTAVLADTPAPVLLVRPDEGSPFVGPQRLLVPLDGSSRAEAALPVATQLARIFDAPLTLVTALSADGPAPLPGEVAGDGAEHWIHPYLRDVQGRLGHAGLDARIEVRTGDAPGVIRAVAEEVGATLIVMATRGHTGLQRLVLGSVADAVLREAERPLLLIRPDPVPEDDPAPTERG